MPITFGADVNHKTQSTLQSYNTVCCCSQKKADFYAMMTIRGTDLQYAARLLTEGKLVAIPTETVYGLAANALMPAAVAAVFDVKKRPAFDPLIVHLPGVEAVERYAVDFPEAARLLADRFWPGPLTLLLSKKTIIPELVTSGLERVALRVPAHPLTLALLRELDFPLAAPSANPFGYISPTTPEHVLDQLDGQIPYVLDGGPCRVGLESTIVGFEQGKPVVYRLGGLPLEALEAVAGKVILRISGSNPQAPGMLQTHYAPRKPLFLGALPQMIEAFKGKKTGLLCFSSAPDGHDAAAVAILSPGGDLSEAAQNLFAALRRLDQPEVDVILAEPAPDTGLGRAINDRLRRAKCN